MADHSVRRQRAPVPLALRSQSPNSLLESLARRSLEHRGHVSLTNWKSQPIICYRSATLVTAIGFSPVLIPLRARLELCSATTGGPKFRRRKITAGRARRILFLVQIFLLWLFYLRLAQRLR